MKAILFTGLAASAVLLASPALADNQGDQDTPLPPEAAAPSTTTVMATPPPAPGPVVNNQTPLPPEAAAPSTTTVMATPPPAPGPVVNTGGSVSGSSPGSGCSERLGTRNAPTGPSNTFNWNNNGDAGWPFGWPGRVAFNTIPTTAPSVGCSR